MNLRPHLLKEAEFARTVYRVLLEPGTAYEDVLKPVFWAHVATKLKPRDRIEIHPHDGSWFAELIVLSGSRVSVVVAELRKVNLETSRAGSEELGDYEVKHRGPRKWSAVHKVTKAVAVEDLDTQDEVKAWLKKPKMSEAA